MHVRRNGLVLLAVALTSAACGSSSGGGSVASAPKGSTVEMATNNYTFSPAVLNGSPGSKVTIHLTNSSGTAHNFSLKEQNVNNDLASGKTADVSVTFPASGQLVFFCEYHRSKGMTGTLVAGTGAASPAASPAAGGGSNGY